MRVSSRGQVTIAAHLRRKHDLRPGDELDIVEDGESLLIIRAVDHYGDTRTKLRAMRGKASTTMSAAELMKILGAISTSPTVRKR